MLSKMKNLVCDEKGQGMTEYGLLLAVVVVVVVGALITFRGQLEDLLDYVVDEIAKVIPTTAT